MARALHQRRRGGCSQNAPQAAEESPIRKVSERKIPVLLLGFAAVAAIVFLGWKIGHRISLGGEDTFSAETSYTEILALASRPSEKNYGSTRCLNCSVLAYVTPWNSKGYDMAKKYRAKFTHVSPVWYQLKRGEQGLFLTGKHDVDQGWIEDVRRGGLPLIVPRVVLEGWPLEKMLLDSAEKQQAIRLLLEECSDMNYDGYVLEAWSSWASLGILANERLRQKALDFVRDMGSSFHKSGKQMLLVIPPRRGNGPNEFRNPDLKFLQQSVDAFSLMTYDYSNAYSPGPNAPLPWVRASLSSLLKSSSPEAAAKILVGLNFYGNDFVLPRGGGPILGNQFTSLLQHHKPRIVWEPISGEHYTDYSDEQQQVHRVYYPTLQSLELRIKEAKQVGAGISIWEIGQGLDYFLQALF